MKNYNGFSGQERAKAGEIIRKAIKKGYIEPPQKCDICGQTNGVLHYHLENYSRPLDDLKPICVGCHMRLHIRFEYPNLWKKHLLDVRAGNKSPAYESPFSFFKAMKAHGITNDISYIDDLDKPNTWYEALSLTPIDLKSN